MEVDPVASMRCWAIELELGGRTFEVPPLPAADWWPVLVSADPALVLDLLTSTPDDDLDELLLTGAIGAKDLSSVLIEVIEEVTGRPFKTAYVLATVAQLQWPMINGTMAQRGFRWDEQPIGAALDAIYQIVVSSLEEKPRKEFLALLDKPLPGRRGKRQREKVVAEFETIAGPRPTTGVKSTGEPSDNARPRTRQRPRLPRQLAPLPEPTPPPG
jgi:hypothetical protein